MTVARRILSAAALLGLLAPRLGASEPATAVQHPAAHELRDGGTSVQQLVEKLLVALKQNDEGALRNLRVTEDEYREIILPGSVEPGKPPRQLVEDWIEFGWNSLEEKNRHAERAMLDRLGGKDLTLRRVTFEGERRYAGYTAYRLPRLQLSNPGAEDLSIETGSIAEVDGRYKFIGFLRN